MTRLKYDDMGCESTLPQTYLSLARHPSQGEALQTMMGIQRASNISTVSHILKIPLQSILYIMLHKDLEKYVNIILGPEKEHS